MSSHSVMKRVTINAKCAPITEKSALKLVKGGTVAAFAATNIALHTERFQVNPRDFQVEGEMNEHRPRMNRIG